MCARTAKVSDYFWLTPADLLLVHKCLAQSKCPMSQLMHNGKVVNEIKSDFQTQVRGSNDAEYQIYLSCANDGNGIDFTTGKPLKSYDEWMGS